MRQLLIERKIFEAMITKLNWIILLLSLLLTTASAEAIPKKTSVLRLLEGRHWELKEEKFLELGEGADEVLRKIVDDPGLINYLRFRALEALSLYENETTAKHLEQLTESPDLSFVRRSFRALSKGFSNTQPERVKKTAQRLLQNSDAHVRIESARAMRSLDEPSFRSFLRTESKVWVRRDAKN